MRLVLFIFSDTVSFILLLVSIIPILISIFLIFRITRKAANKNPINQFFSLLILLLGIVAAIIFQSAIFLLSALSLALVLMIPHIVYHLKELKLEKEKTESAENTEIDLEQEVEQIREKDKELNKILFELSNDIIVEASNNLSSEKGLQETLEHINTAIIEEINADGGVILLIDAFDDIIAVKSLIGSFPPPYELSADIPHKIIRVETNFRFASFPLDSTIFGEIARTGRAELITEPLSDPRLFQNEPEDFLKLGSYIFIPLLVKDSVLGVAAFARKFENPCFTEEEFYKAEILARFASSAIRGVFSYQELAERNELTKEADMAVKIQERYHPKLLPAIPGLSLGHYYNTAGVCGDFFDIVPSRKDRISFVLADVAGKGMNSLLIMTMLRSILRLVLNTTHTASTILSWANRGISTEKTIDHFASIALILYNSLDNTIQYANAGTSPIYLLRNKTEEFECLSKNSEPIGVEKTSVYSDNSTKVEKNDIIITFTDGLIEALDSSGNQYTTSRLTRLIKQNKDLTGKEIANKIKEDMKRFSGDTKQHDDQTLLVIKIL